jgi:DNA topoisomerase-2
MYVKKSQRQHVLDRPETYVGSVALETQLQWTLTGDGQMRERACRFAPALFQIFDEILVNAADNAGRNGHDVARRSKKGGGGGGGKADKQRMTELRVDILKDERISVWNDGACIPIVMHQGEGCYVPEMIFGKLLTSSNYDDTQARFTGGRHGFGAKLTNILSTEFKVEIYDAVARLTYAQTFRDNMSVVEAPVIEEVAEGEEPGGRTASWTRITFRPDFPRFGMQSLSRVDARASRAAAKLAAEAAAAANNTASDGTASALRAEDASSAGTVVDVMRRRVYDIAACLAHTFPHIKVKLNKKVVMCKSFVDYVKLFPLTSDAADVKDLYYWSNKQWEVVIAPATAATAASHMSFVNCIATTRGGAHVRYVTNELIQAVFDFIIKLPEYKEFDLRVLQKDIRAHFALFINARLPNPAFDGQTKDALVGSPASIAAVYPLPKRFIKQVVEQSGIVERVMEEAVAKAKVRLMRKSRMATKGIRGDRQRILSIPKLDDAVWAGTRRGAECTLILTEGDSAKALAVAGLAIVGRERYGIFPLRGKMLNVREATLKQVSNNKEVQCVQQILGLELGRDYSSESARASMRYGKVMLMTDQDVDGSHIKGLFINMLHAFWPSLLHANDFVEQFVTPLIKVFPGASGGGSGKKDNKASAGVLSFYNQPDFHAWQRRQQAFLKSSSSGGTGGGDGGGMRPYRQYRTKYYKGLGTSTAAEARSYFSQLEQKHRICFVYDGVQNDADVKLAFLKSKADERKNWLVEYQASAETAAANDVASVRKGGGKASAVEPKMSQSVSLSEFIHSELVLFSIANIVRAIPHVADGLKPGQRKVLHACFKRKLTSELKVAQLAGYVAEHTGYHHGEVSLHATIVNMAQAYVGSNNLPLLYAGGQFGTRHMGGSDAASARYIFTRLHTYTRAIFMRDDDATLRLRDEDGLVAEPHHFAPIIPTALLNGASGIGTGFSTSVPAFSIDQLISNLRLKLHGKKMKSMTPSYRGFKGTVEKVENGDFVSHGVAKRLSKTTVEITELPVKISGPVKTESYKTMLTKAMGVGGQALAAAEVVQERRMKKKSAKAKKRRRGVGDGDEDGVHACVDDEEDVAIEVELVIRQFTEHHTDDEIRFVVHMHESDLDAVMAAPGGLLRAFRLSAFLRLGNMYFFDCQGRIRLYDTPLAIMSEYYDMRLKTYGLRKEYLIARTKASVASLSNRASFVQLMCNGKLVVANTKRADLIAQLESFGIKKSVPKKAGANADDGVTATVLADDAAVDTIGDYDSLLSMPLSSLTREKVDQLNAQIAALRDELTTLEATSVEQAWLRDLDALVATIADADAAQARREVIDSD